MSCNFEAVGWRSQGYSLHDEAMIVEFGIDDRSACHEHQLQMLHGKWRSAMKADHERRPTRHMHLDDFYEDRAAEGFLNQNRVPWVLDIFWKGERNAY
jgi:hypothetical protein